MTGIIFDIKRFAVHDGPGIRTTVFLKGCPLRCRWCHNPESWVTEPQLACFPRQCIGCEACIRTCEHGAVQLTEWGPRINRELCVVCGACAEACVAEALVIEGREVTAEEVIDEVLRDRTFYETSGGGMTLSGGEPLMQPRFALELLRLARDEGLHTAVDTSGAVPWQTLEQAAELTDLFLYDVKALDPERHRAMTGSGNEKILANLRRLADSGAEIVLRVPLIPGHNDSPAEVDGLAELALEIDAPVELLPYHRLGGGKFAALGITRPEFEANEPEDEHVEALRERLRDAGVGQWPD